MHLIHPEHPLSGPQIPRSGKPTIRPSAGLLSERRAHVGQTGFDDLSLVVIYNRAAIYNSPAETLYSYEDAAADIGRLLRGKLGLFDRMFLFLAFQPGGRVLLVSEARP